MGETLLFMVFCIVIWALIGYSIVFDDLYDFWPQKKGSGRFIPKKKGVADMALPSTPEEVRAYQARLAEEKQATEVELTAGHDDYDKTARDTERMDDLRAIRATANLGKVLSDLRPDAEGKRSRHQQGTPSRQIGKRADLDDLQALRSDRNRPQKAGSKLAGGSLSKKPKKSIIEAANSSKKDASDS